MPFTNTGTVDVLTSGGELHLRGNGTDTGAYTVASGATLTFATSGTTRNFNAGSGVAGAGNVGTSFGTVNFNAGSAFNATGQFTQSSGTTNFNTGATVSFVDLQLAGGTLGLNSRQELGYLFSLVLLPYLDAQGITGIQTALGYGEHEVIEALSDGSVDAAILTPPAAMAMFEKTVFWAFQS